MTTKLIITNDGMLKTKYADFKSIQTAVEQWMAADKKRGIESIYAPIDDAAFMRSAHSAPVAHPDDLQGVKRAIDDVYHYFKPDCGVILGSYDIVPHQKLCNPVLDDDPYVLSDLPYACDSPFSNRIELFRTPSRVLTRLPDATGEHNTGGLIAVLQLASSLGPKPKSSYDSYFAVSSFIYDQSSILTLKAVFNNASNLKDVPPNNSKWSAEQLGRNLHFFNCHGYSTSATWYGNEPGQPLTPALEASSLKGTITAGTLVAAECCFGAELYDVSVAGRQLPVCNMYLQNGAAALFGSSNISYGQESSTDWADILCEYFLEEMLSGQSVGVSGLNARLRYTQRKFTDKDQKTFAQFMIFGDASALPVLPGGDVLRKAKHGKNSEISNIGRLQVEWLEIMATPEIFRQRIKNLAQEHGFSENLEFRSFRVEGQQPSEKKDAPGHFTEIHTGTGKKSIDGQHFITRGIELTAVGDDVVWSKGFYRR
jgi:hypothetical protein